MVLGGIKKTAWVTKLLLTAAWASLVNRIDLCHILKAQHCFLSSNGCFNLPLAPHPPPTPKHPSHRPLTKDSIGDITGIKQNHLKKQ